MASKCPVCGGAEEAMRVTFTVTIEDRSLPSKRCRLSSAVSAARRRSRPTP